MEATATTPVVRQGRRRRVMSRRRAVVRRPLAGLVLCGIGLMLLGAWGGIVAYAGPAFGYGPVGAHAWQWSTQHTVLYLVPGAATVLAGILVAGAAGRRAAGALGGLLALGAAAWFVLGALVYPIFYGSGPVFTPGAGHAARAELAIRTGYGLGVGLAVALLAGMALAMVARRPLRAPSDGRMAADPVVDVRDRPAEAAAAEEEVAGRRAVR